MAPFYLSLSTSLLMISLILPWQSYAEDCHNKSQSACEKNDECTWVHGYTRSDKVKVDSYCRAKPGHADHATKSHPSKDHSTKSHSTKEHGIKDHNPKKKTKSEKSHPKQSDKKSTQSEKHHTGEKGSKHSSRKTSDKKTKEGKK